MYKLEIVIVITINGIAACKINDKEREKNNVKKLTRTYQLPEPLAIYMYAHRFFEPSNEPKTWMDL